MKTSGIYSPCAYTVDVKSLKRPIHLAVLGDIHRDASGFSSRAWRHHRRKLSTLENLYGILIGDYLDFASTSERKQMRDTHESTLKRMDIAVIDDVEKLAAEIQGCGFLGIAFLLNGNHVWEFTTNHLASFGTSALQQRGYPIVPDSDHLLAHILKTNCPGVMTICNFTLHYHGARLSYKIAGHHGKGGGSTIGSALNPIEKMSSNVEADIYVQGHTHQMAAAKRVRICLADNKTKHRTITMIRNGSFLKAYEDGEPSHVVDSQMTPAHLGGAVIRFDLFNEEIKGQKTFSAETMVMF